MPIVASTLSAPMTPGTTWRANASGRGHAEDARGLDVLGEAQRARLRAGEADVDGDGGDRHGDRDVHRARARGSRPRRAPPGTRGRRAARPSRASPRHRPTRGATPDRAPTARPIAKASTVASSPMPDRPPGAVDDARVHVAAALVGAEEVLGAGRQQGRSHIGLQRILRSRRAGGTRDGRDQREHEAARPTAARWAPVMRGPSRARPPRSEHGGAAGSSSG